MKIYEVSVDENSVYTAVYNITANAAVQRGDAAHVATEGNTGILAEFLKEGKAAVMAALGRYGNGLIEKDGKEVLIYSMPASWDFKKEIDVRVNAFLVDYVIARWVGLAAEAETPIVELMSILNKRNKPL